jgi:hypothetical protein
MAHSFTLSLEAIARIEAECSAVIFVTDYRGREYRDFEAARSHHGSGWIVQGRNVAGVGVHCYGGNVVMKAAEPRFSRKSRKLRGWKTKREAAAVASRMCAALPPPPPPAIASRATPCDDASCHGCRMS